MAGTDPHTWTTDTRVRIRGRWRGRRMGGEGHWREVEGEWQATGTGHHVTLLTAMPFSLEEVRRRLKRRIEACACLSPSYPRIYVVQVSSLQPQTNLQPLLTTRTPPAPSLSAPPSSSPTVCLTASSSLLPSPTPLVPTSPAMRLPRSSPLSTRPRRPRLSSSVSAPSSVVV